jgi:hypothetical protein
MGNLNETLQQFSELEYLKLLIEKNAKLFKEMKIVGEDTIPQLMYLTIEALYEFVLLVQAHGLYPEDEDNDKRVDFALANSEALIQSFVDLTEYYLANIALKDHRSRVYNNVSQFIFYSLNLLEKVINEHERY